MKKLISLIVIAFCLTFTSCKTLRTFYQVCDVKSSLPLEKGAYVYTDKNCKISYNFWENGGNPGFLFRNNTDEIIYIDLAKSFFIKNGVTHDYFQNRETTLMTTYSVSKSNKKGEAVAFTTAVNTEHTSKSTTYIEKSIVAIPPHASRFIHEYTISESIIDDCDINLIPKNQDEPVTYKYSLANTPLTFENLITYRVGDSKSENNVRHNFFISDIVVYTSRQITGTNRITCHGKTIEAKFLNAESPTSYYIQYEYEVKSEHESTEYYQPGE